MTEETFESYWNSLITLNGKLVKAREHLDKLKQLHDSEILNKVKENTQIMINEQEKLLKEKDSELQTKEMLLNTAQAEINRLLLLTDKKDKEIEREKREGHLLASAMNLAKGDIIRRDNKISELQAEVEKLKLSHYCKLCNGEDKASICEWCYNDKKRNKK